jgi:hypothetical protein
MGDDALVTFGIGFVGKTRQQEQEHVFNVTQEFGWLR